MNKTEIKKWIKKNKVLFLTNPYSVKDEIYKTSFSTYMDYVPTENINIVEGIQNNRKIYNIHVFYTMIKKTYNPNDNLSKFDYIIYIDEDCFITDFETMLEEFKRFMTKDQTISGVPDGGSCCHRSNHHNLINTFFSFWNLKLIRETVDLEELEKYVYKYIGNSWYSVSPTGYIDFVNDMLSSMDTKILFYTLNKNADRQFLKMEKYRVDNYGKKLSPYAEFIKDDPAHPSKKRQNPYTYLDVLGRDIQFNEEPYYALEQALLMTSKKLIGFLNATDSYDPNLPAMCEETDNTGCSTMVMDENFKPFAIHTWYTRHYKKNPKTPFQVRHTNRIDRIINYIKNKNQ